MQPGGLQENWREVHRRLGARRNLAKRTERNADIHSRGVKEGKMEEN
jgi:hypothetical protein